MIEIFEKPVKTVYSQIDELYDGKHVAYAGTKEMFIDDLCYVIAIGDKNDENYDKLDDFLDIYLEEHDTFGGMCVGNKNREGESLYVEFRDVQ